MLSMTDEVVRGFDLYLGHAEMCVEMMLSRVSSEPCTFNIVRVPLWANEIKVLWIHL